MTREELKEHCERQIQQFERVEKLMPVTPNDWKRYEEHKLVLELLERELFINKPCVSEKSCEHDKNVVLGKIRAEIVELTKCPYSTECLGANCPSNTDCMICGDHVLEILDKYKSESEEYKEKSPWTKCSDNLPDMNVDVLGTTKDYGVVLKVIRMLSKHEAAGWEWVLSNDSEGASFSKDEIIAWMPLPEAYKESEEVND